MNTKKEKVKVRYEKGLHIRVAAMIVQMADEIQKKYKVNFKIKVGTFNEVPLTSILLVTSLKIKQDDELDLITEGEEVEKASEEMKEYLESHYDVEKETISKVDNLLQGNMLTSESILSAIDNGLMVVDKRQMIVVYKRYF